MTVEYEPVIGIETHVQLNTRSKMFCPCPTEFGAPPNSQVCPVCLGHPGVLPVINRAAVERAILAALALGCRVSEFTKFDRKNYFYPDLPKNYQISQYDIPLAKEGRLPFEVGGEPRSVRIERLHMEEDAGKLVHEEGGSKSFVDLNRAGTPLVEIVSRPDMRSAEDAAAYMNALRQIMRAIRVSECDMEKGQFRCDVNVSVRPKGTEALGVKVEIKNLNSFKFAADAIRFETRRQIQALGQGEKIVQETRLFDPAKQITSPMRTKEGVSDYRYFPEPDLPPLVVSRELINEIRSRLPELPLDRKRRFASQYGLSEYDAGVLTADSAIADFFEAAAKRLGKPKVAANWITNEVLKILNETKKEAVSVSPEEFAELLAFVESGRITPSSAKSALAEMMSKGSSAAEVVRALGLEKLSDPAALQEAVEAAIRDNPKAVADLKGGKQATEKFLVGYVMRLTKGRADAALVSQLLRKKVGM